MDMRKRMLNRLPRNGRWYDIRNADDADTATVRIYDEIGVWGVTEEDFARELALITAANIEVQISSPGGDVFAATAIYNALRLHPATVTTRVDGIAASAASVIVQAGDHRVMVASSQMMIHEAWGVAVGPAAEMREFADLLDTQNEIIADIYAARSPKSADEIRELMAAETWLKDAAAVELGLADEVFNPSKAQEPDEDEPEEADDPDPEPDEEADGADEDEEPAEDEPEEPAPDEDADDEPAEEDDEEDEPMTAAQRRRLLATFTMDPPTAPAAGVTKDAAQGLLAVCNLKGATA